MSQGGEKVPVSVWMKRLRQEARRLRCVVMLEPVERLSAWVAFQSDVSMGSAPLTPCCASLAPPVVLPSSPAVLPSHPTVSPLLPSCPAVLPSHPAVLPMLPFSLCSPHLLFFPSPVLSTYPSPSHGRGHPLLPTCLLGTVLLALWQIVSTLPVLFCLDMNPVPGLCLRLSMQGTEGCVPTALLLGGV